jgi:hypothetical protein
VSLKKSYKVVEYFSNEMLRILNVVALAATKWFGKGLVQLAVDHAAENLTSFYMLPFTWKHNDMETAFTLDVRQTFQPEWDTDMVSLFFLGDLTYPW